MFRFFISLVVITTSVAVYGQNTDITFKAIGFQEKEIYLGYHLAEQKFIEDTLAVGEGGLITIRSKEGLRPGLYFMYSPAQFYQEFVINESKFSITADGEGYANFEVSGSKENEVFKNFQLSLGAIQKERTKIIDSLNGSTGEDSVRLQKSLMELIKQSTEAKNAIIDENPDLMITKMIRLLQPVPLGDFSSEPETDARRLKEYTYYRNQFKDRLDFNEIGLLRTPVFKANVMKYLTEVIPQVPDTIITEVERALDLVQVDQPSFRFWLVTFTNHYQTSKLMGMETVAVHLLDKYYLNGRADWISEESLEKMREEVAYLKPNQIGQPAPRLQLVDTTMSPVNPLQFDDKYLVLFFYDPECGHCKKKTPILRDAYYDLKDLGAEVVAVSTISDIPKWKEYIIKNELDWINLADPQTRSNFRAEYNVRSVPQVYVLDQNRKIIAKKLDVAQLVEFITNYSRIVNP